MPLMTELDKTAETAKLAGALAYSDPTQKKIWTILSVMVYGSVSYTAWRLTRGTWKLARKSK